LGFSRFQIGVEPFILESNLGIRNRLLGAMMVDNMLPSEGLPPQALGGGGKDAGAEAAPNGKGDRNQIYHRHKRQQHADLDID
jgi:hypothetical protein